MNSDSMLTDEEKRVFKSSIESWKGATAVFSSPHQIKDHNGYRMLTAMGTNIIPDLMEELAEYPWVGFLEVLYSIAGVGGHPKLLEEHRGKIGRISAMWIHWGMENHYYGIAKFYKLVAQLDKSFPGARTQ